MAENQNKSTTLVSIQVIYYDKTWIAKYNENTNIQLKKSHKRVAGGKNHKLKKKSSFAICLKLQT